MFGVGTRMQKERNIGIDRDRIFRDIMDYSHWKANAALVRTFVDRSASVIHWLADMGVEFIEPAAFVPGGPQTWHLFKGYGAAMIKVLLTIVKEKNIDIRYETTVREIIRKEKGPVAGVVTEDSAGRKTQVKACCAVVATGGYANDRELLKRYTGMDLRTNLFPIGNFEKYGEGIKMGWAIGAAADGMGVLNYSFGGPVGPGIRPSGCIVAAVRQPELWINQHGRRFCDESIVHNVIHCGNVMSRQKGGYVFRVFDDNARRHYMERGIDVGVGTFVPKGTCLAGFDDEIRTALEKKNRNVFTAGTIEDLSGQMGVPPDVFQQTVDEYNKFCQIGYDEQFAKDKIYLRPFKTPPYFGFKCYVDFCATHGGIKINEKAEALDHEENVIPGLYAVGNDAGGLYGDSYDLIASGTASGFAMVSGRIAGENALRYCHISEERQ
jgi:fumarate reductase flavoprotein subunit